MRCRILLGERPMKDKGRIGRGSYNANLTPVKIEKEKEKKDWT